MIKKSFKRDSEDLLVELLSSRLVELVKLRSESSRIESRILSVQLELLTRKVLFQEVEVHFCMLQELLMIFKE